jgi:hypothetical protein
VIYVYGIGEREPADASVESIRHDGLVAYVRRDVEAAPEPTPDELWRHEKTLAQLMEDGAVLPMRFGTVLEDDDALRAVLEARRNTLRRSLALVRGRVEMGVRAQWPEPGSRGDASSGREFMVAKLERQRRARRLAGIADASLGTLSERRVCSLLPRAGTAFAASYLVDRTRIGEFRARASAVRARVHEADVVCTGPWAPYSFSEAGE